MEKTIKALIKLAADIRYFSIENDVPLGNHYELSKMIIIYFDSMYYRGTPYSTIQLKGKEKNVEITQLSAGDVGVWLHKNCLTAKTLADFYNEVKQEFEIIKTEKLKSLQEQIQAEKTEHIERLKAELETLTKIIYTNE